MWRGDGRRRLIGHLAPPGLPRLLARAPTLREPEGLLRAAVALGAAFGGSYGRMQRLDQGGALGTVAGQLWAYGTVFGLGWRLFRSGPRFRQRYGELAYQEAVYTYLIPIAGPVLATFAHILTVPGRRALPLLLTLAPGLYLLMTGVGLALRAIRILGMDSAALLYLYFPEEGRHVTGGIYRLLRHPLYASGARLALGLALLRGRVRALALAGLAVAWFHVWARLEERELMRRFGPSYQRHRERVPALIPDSLATEARLLGVLWG